MEKMWSCQSDPVVKFSSRSLVLFTQNLTQFSYLSSHNDFLRQAVGDLASSHSQAMLSYHVWFLPWLWKAEILAPSAWGPGVLQGGSPASLWTQRRTKQRFLKGRNSNDWEKLRTAGKSQYPCSPGKYKLKRLGDFILSRAERLISTNQCKLTQSLWKPVYIDLPYDPDIPLLGVCPRDYILLQRSLLILAHCYSSTVARVWKQPRCLLTDV